MFTSLILTLSLPFLQVAQDRIENSKQGLTLPAYSKKELWSLTGHDLANICNGLKKAKRPVALKLQKVCAERYHHILGYLHQYICRYLRYINIFAGKR